jgi:hypothetical protein
MITRTLDFMDHANQRKYNITITADDLATCIAMAREIKTQADLIINEVVAEAEIISQKLNDAITGE